MQEKLHLNEEKAAAPKHGLGLRTVVAAFVILILIPATMWVGIVCLKDRKYYYISLLIIIYTLVPFFMVFEDREPKARELIIISVLATAVVIGRSVFFMLPAFKPMIAIVVIAGVTFGAESGFLVGAVGAFASNFIFGQGPWTPWQMFSLGLIGFLAGVMHLKGLLPKKRLPLCIFGGVSTYLIYGLIMNFASLLMFSDRVTKGGLIAVYMSGIPYDTVHAVATVFFMYVLAEPMIERLDRVRLKYGMIR